MIDEVALYRIGATAFLASLPVGLILVVLPAKSPTRQRVRLLSIGFIGIGLCFLGFSASWPAPNTVTIVIMLGGVFMFLGSMCLLGRSLLHKNRTRDYLNRPAP